MRNLILTIAMAILSLTVFSDNVDAATFDQSHTLILKKTPNGNNENTSDEEFKGTRSPSLPLVCTITEYSIDIPGVDINTVQSFEVYSLDGPEAVHFNDMSQFCSFVMSYYYDMEIRIVTHDYIYNGWLYF